jgi:uncharacterized membrane protein (DUF2068 family)
MKRLPGVIVSAILLIIGSLFQFLGAALMGFGAFLVPGMHASTNAPAPVQPAWLPWFSLGIAAVCFGFGAWGMITAIGLFRMKRWARYCTLIIGGLVAFFGVPGMIMMIAMSVISLPTPAGIDPAQAHTMQFVSRIMFVVIAMFYACTSSIGIWWLVYFNRKAVREAFAGGSVSLAPSRRPVLISILAVLNMIGVATCTIMAFAPIPMAIFGLIVHGWAKTVTLLIFAALAAMCGAGLWQLQEWGRKTAIGLQCIGLINYMFFVFRPTVLQRYQKEVNRSLYLQQSALLPPHVQSTIQYGTFGIGICFLLAVIAILHHYRRAFKQPTNPAAAQPELIG